MRLLVCGGRDYDDAEFVRAWLLKLRPSLVISGFAPGADTLAYEAALELGYPQMIFPANWRGEGNAAGMIRNRRMLTEGRPDFGLAFPGGVGTEGMVGLLGGAGIKVKRVWGSLI